MRLLRQAAKLGLGVMALAGAAVLFQRPARLLPAPVRLASPGFQAIVGAAVLAGLLRQSVLGDRPVAVELLGWAIVTGILVLIAGGRRLAAVCIFMAASIGVDLAAAALQAFASVAPAASNPWLSAWQIAATAVGVVQVANDTRRQAT